jgi:predicted ester cyclase
MKRSLNLLVTGALGMMIFAACAKNGNQAANGAADSAKMTADANIAKTKAFYENVMNAHKPDAAAEYCEASFVDHNPDPGHSGQGIDDLKAQFGQWFAMMPDAHVTVDKITADGDMVWAYLTVTGTMKGDMGPMKANGKSVKINGVDIVKIQNGKAVERWGVFDSYGMMSQLGFIPQPGAPAGNEKKM